MVIRSYGYIRVSPRPEVRYSPDVQERTIRDFADRAADDRRLLGIEQDLLVSGRKAGERPGRDKIIGLIEAGKVDEVVFADLSRLSRDDVDVFWGDVLGPILRAGGRIHSIAEPHLSEMLATDAPYAKSLLTFAVEANHQAAKVNAEKTRQGIAAARAAGVWHGTVPFGWRRVGMVKDGAARGGAAGIEPDTDGDLERLILAYQLRSKGWSYNRIATYLRADASTIRKAIGSPRNRDLVGAELWDRVQPLKRVLKGRGNQRAYLFAGMLRCPHCGGLMHGKPNFSPSTGRTFPHYSCRRYQSDHPWRTMSEDRIIGPVLALLERFRLHGIPERADATPAHIRTMRNERRRKLAELERREKRLNDAIEFGVMDMAEAKRRRAQIEAEREDVPPEPVEPQQVKQDVEDLTRMLPDLARASRHWFADTPDGDDARRLVNATNTIIRRLLDIQIDPDRTVTVMPRMDKLDVSTRPTIPLPKAP